MGVELNLAESEGLSHNFTNFNIAQDRNGIR